MWSGRVCRDPYELADWAMAQAAQLSGGAQARSLKKLPATLDLFGWCTWDAFYFTVSAQGEHIWYSTLRAAVVLQHALVWYHNVCYTCPRSTLLWALWKVLQWLRTWAKSGACVAKFVLGGHS